jgi:hypothetical protein
VTAVTDRWDRRRLHDRVGADINAAPGNAGSGSVERESAMTIDAAERHYNKTATDVAGRPRDFEIVCLFSALGLILTAVAMALGASVDMAGALALMVD